MGGGGAPAGCGGRFRGRKLNAEALGLKEKEGAAALSPAAGAAGLGCPGGGGGGGAAGSLSSQLSGASLIATTTLLPLPLSN